MKKGKRRTFLDERRRKNNPHWQHQTVKRAEFDGEWPFLVDEVTIENRDSDCCTITIDGRDYALNGWGKTQYGLPDPYECRQAVTGRSIAPFIEMALALGDG